MFLMKKAEYLKKPSMSKLRTMEDKLTLFVEARRILVETVEFCDEPCRIVVS